MMQPTVMDTSTWGHLGTWLYVVIFLFVYQIPGNHRPVYGERECFMGYTLPLHRKKGRNVELTQMETTKCDSSCCCYTQGCCKCSSDPTDLQPLSIPCGIKTTTYIKTPHTVYADDCPFYKECYVNTTHKLFPTLNPTNPTDVESPFSLASVAVGIAIGVLFGAVVTLLILQCFTNWGLSEDEELSKTFEGVNAGTSVDEVNHIRWQDVSHSKFKSPLEADTYV